MRDFGVHHDDDGQRVVTLDVCSEGHHHLLRRAGSDHLEVTIASMDRPLPLPAIKLDSLAAEFNKEHHEGTGDIRFKAMMCEAADRTENRPAYSPKGKVSSVRVF